jgi:hypothetical protein
VRVCGTSLQLDYASSVASTGANRGEGRRRAAA